MTGVLPILLAAAAVAADPLLVAIPGAEEATIDRRVDRWIVSVSGKTLSVPPPRTPEDRAMLRALVTSLLTEIVPLPPPPSSPADPLSARLLRSLPAPVDPVGSGGATSASDRGGGLALGN